MGGFAERKTLGRGYEYCAANLVPRESVIHEPYHTFHYTRESAQCSFYTLDATGNHPRQTQFISNSCVGSLSALGSRTRGVVRGGSQRGAPPEGIKAAKPRPASSLYQGPAASFLKVQIISPGQIPKILLPAIGWCVFWRTRQVRI